MTISDALKQLISIRVDTELHIRTFPDALIFQDDLDALNIAINILGDILMEEQAK